VLQNVSPNSITESDGHIPDEGEIPCLVHTAQTAQTGGGTQVTSEFPNIQSQNAANALQTFQNNIMQNLQVNPLYCSNN